VAELSSREKREVIPPGSPGLSDTDKNTYNQWLPERFDTEHRLSVKLPVAVFPTHFDRRISAQSSCFTIHGRDRRGLDELFTNRTAHLAKIVIPSYAIEDIREELSDFAVDEATIYPDLPGLGIAVTKNWLFKELPLPHYQLYTRLQPSPIHGIGVFAIQDIPKGPLFSEDLDEMRWIEKADLHKQKQLRKFYDDFAVWKNGRFGCPKHFHHVMVSERSQEWRKAQRAMRRNL
jgi:hypothetical protein